MERVKDMLAEWQKFRAREEICSVVAGTHIVTPVANIIVGIFAIVLGVASAGDLPINIGLAVIGALTFISGIVILKLDRVRPGSLALLSLVLHSVQFCIIGIWYFFIIISALLQGWKYFPFPPEVAIFYGGLGGIQIWAGIMSLLLYRRFKKAFAEKYNEEAVRRVDGLIASIIKDESLEAQNLIEFKAKGLTWKGRLMDDVVVFVGSKRTEVLFGERGDVCISTQGETGRGGELRASVQIGPRIFKKAAISRNLMDRYEAWKVAATI